MYFEISCFLITRNSNKQIIWDVQKEDRMKDKDIFKGRHFESILGLPVFEKKYKFETKV